MKRLTLLSLAVLVALAGCDEGGDDIMMPAPIMLTMQNVPQLTSGHYEAWISFPVGDDPAPRAGIGFLHDDTELVSIGAFNVSIEGDVLALDGRPIHWELSGPGNLNLAEEVLVSFQPDGLDEPGPIMFAGPITGDDTTGRATLTTTHADAIVADLSLATGTATLATPSNGPDTDESHGLWFADLSQSIPVTSLDLDPLGEGWIYEGWVIRDGTPRSLGRFSLATAPDSDGKGEFGGALPGFNTPGSDFIDVIDFATGQTDVLVTVEDAPRPGTTPFALRALTLSIDPGAVPGTALMMSGPSQPLPTGSASFTR